jgi:hypothetical protein
MDCVFDPYSLPETEFLSGPGGAELVVDDVFAKDFPRVVAELEEARPGSTKPSRRARRTPSDLAPGYAFVEVPAGILVLAPDGSPAGGLLDCDLAILPAHRGRGLGAETVLEYFMREGRLPTWDHDKPAYSRAGRAACLSAWRQARDRSLFDKKAARLLPWDLKTPILAVI